MSNPEQAINENLAEVKEFAKPDGGLAIARGPELERVVDYAKELAEKISRDEDVTAQEVLGLDKALAKIIFDVNGEEMTIEEAKKNPKLQEQIKINKEIIAGDPSRYRKLTWLTKQASESLSRHEGDLHFDKLKFLSDEAAESLSHHPGDLGFASLGSISDAAAEIFSHHQNVLLPDNIRKIVDKFKEKNNVQPRTT